MKRFAFRLDPVLRVRRLGERSARGRLLTAQRILATAQRDVAERHAEVVRRQSVPLPVATPAFRVEQALRSASVDCLTAARLVEADALLGVRTATESWTAAAAAVGALERLEERQREQHRILAIRDEDRLTDELVSARRPEPVA